MASALSLCSRPRPAARLALGSLPLVLHVLFGLASEASAVPVEFSFGGTITFAAPSSPFEGLQGTSFSGRLGYDTDTPPFDMRIGRFPFDSRAEYYDDDSPSGPFLLNIVFEGPFEYSPRRTPPISVVDGSVDRFTFGILSLMDPRSAAIPPLDPNLPLGSNLGLPSRLDLADWPDATIADIFLAPDRTPQLGMIGTIEYLTPVPEPGTGLLLAMGLAAFSAVTRREGQRAVKHSGG